MGVDPADVNKKSILYSSFTLQPIPAHLSSRNAVPNYDMDPKSAAGLPTGFAFDPAWSENRSRENNIRLNARTLAYYVNDGPQGPHEDATQYRMRIRRATENMGIEHRVMPVLSEEEIRQFNGDKVAIDEARRKLKNKIRRDSTTHHSKLKYDGNNHTHDKDYASTWKAEKRARQARNAVRRRNAQEKLRAEFMTRNECLGQRLPTPPPPDDSCDELYDFTIANRPRIVAQQRDTIGRPRQYQNDGSAGTSTHSCSGGQSKSPLRCARCEEFRAHCSTPEAGASRFRCQRLEMECLQQNQQHGGNFINIQTAQVLTSIAPDTLENGGSPTVETTSDFGFDDWIPCNTCLMNDQACDNDEPPCGSCIIHGVESSCNSVGAEDQSQQARRGSYISPYQSMPQPTPTAPVNWDEIVENLEFSSTTALGAASPEAQNPNWTSNADRVWSGGARYNAFGQELDMNGNVLPGRRIFSGVVDQDLDKLYNTVDNGHSSVNPSTTNTDEDMRRALLAYIDDQPDTIMGGTRS
ncbi:hypothetical protein IFR05_002631 [Cadophora sp. M221]|nr:hypothetical protein IFR05_002631 [Cadophora sp. M221]